MVIHGRKRKKGRIHTNTEVDGALLDEAASSDPEDRALLAHAAERLRLPARGYHPVTRVACAWPISELR